MQSFVEVFRLCGAPSWAYHNLIQSNPCHNEYFYTAILYRYIEDIVVLLGGHHTNSENPYYKLYRYNPTYRCMHDRYNKGLPVTCYSPRPNGQLAGPEE